MAIPSTRYVIIQSGVTGASAVAERELVGLRFSYNSRMPVDRVFSFSSAAQVAEFFGNETPEAEFALQYFSYVSPPPATIPQRLKFAAFAPAGRSPMIFGDTLSRTLDQLKTITAGTLTIANFGSSSLAVTGVDFSAATSLADVASALQAAIRLQAGYESATVAYGALMREFIITKGTVEGGSVSGVSGTIADALGLSSPAAVLSPGTLAQTPLEAFQRAEQVTDSFGTASFSRQGYIMDLETDVIPLAQYIASLNVKYMMLWTVTPLNAADWSAALINTASNALILTEDMTSQHDEALPMAIAASVDYDRPNAVVNFMFRNSTITVKPLVTTEQGANLYDPLRVNYLGQTASAGQNIIFLQRGYMTGNPVNAIVDMGAHLNEQWLKATAAARLLNLLIGKGVVPANQDGIGYVLAVLSELAEQAKDNGTIISGKELTAFQRAEITSLTGDEKAHFDVFNKGYWLGARVVRETGPSGIEEFVIKYTLVYSANVGVRKIEGSHNLITV